ncbi:unnamed protein product [Caenorhabditis brenneri]
MRMQVFVVDEQKYREFEPINEMLVKRGGVKMHPEPQFMIRGLSPDEEYILKLRIEMVDELRYIYQTDQWIPISSASRNARLCKCSTSETPKETGSTWNEIIVKFEKLRITRELSEIRQNVIYVEPNHKYIPILSIINTSTGVSVDFRFDLLQFVAVKSFHSIAIRHAKRSTRTLSLLGPCPSITEEMEKPKNVMNPRLIQNNLYQMNQFYPYTYGYSSGFVAPTVQYHPYRYDYLYCYPQLQYPLHQLHHPLLVPPTQIQYSQPKTEQNIYKSEIKEYVPEYGWNPILVPEAKTESDENVHLGLHHNVWTPQKMELENLYFKTEQISIDLARVASAFLCFYSFARSLFFHTVLIPKRPYNIHWKSIGMITIGFLTTGILMFPYSPTFNIFVHFYVYLLSIEASIWYHTKTFKLYSRYPKKGYGYAEFHRIYDCTVHCN